MRLRAGVAMQSTKRTKFTQVNSQPGSAASSWLPCTLQIVSWATHSPRSGEHAVGQISVNCSPTTITELLSGNRKQTSLNLPTFTTLSPVKCSTQAPASSNLASERGLGVTGRTKDSELHQQRHVRHSSLAGGLN